MIEWKKIITFQIILKNLFIKLKILKITSKNLMFLNLFRILIFIYIHKCNKIENKNLKK